MPELWQNNLENGFYIVPYYFVDDEGKEHTEEEKENIRASLTVFEENTCLKMRQVNFDDSSYPSRLRITREDEGCWSYVG